MIEKHLQKAGVFFATTDKNMKHLTAIILSVILLQISCSKKEKGEEPPLIVSNCNFMPYNLGTKANYLFRGDSIVHEFNQYIKAHGEAWVAAIKNNSSDIDILYRCDDEFVWKARPDNIDGVNFFPERIVQTTPKVNETWHDTTHTDINGDYNITTRTIIAVDTTKVIEGITYDDVTTVFLYSELFNIQGFRYDSVYYNEYLSKSYGLIESFRGFRLKEIEF